MSDSSRSSPSPDREAELRIKRRRLAELEIETRRLKADILRLRAAGEDQQADRLAAELVEREGDLASDHAALDRMVHEVRPSTSSGEGPRPTARQRLSDAQPTDRSAPTGPSVQALPNVRPSKDATQAQGPHRRRSLARRTPIHRRGKSGARSRGLKKQPAWSVSLLVHGVLLLLCGLWSFATSRPPLPLLTSGPIDSTPLATEELLSLDFEPEAIEELLPVEPAFAADLAAELEVDEPRPVAESTAPEPAATGLEALLQAEVGALLTPVSGSLAGDGDAAGSPSATRPGAASFFGAQAEGNRFAFLIDNSGTMKDGRMETAFLELLRCVGAMRPDQEFYVIFYSDQAYPMFYPESVHQMVPATRENKQQLEAWLGTVEMCMGGELNDAVEMAARLEPAAVYLLSDGDIADSRIERLTRSAAERSFTIHTFGMTVRNPTDAAKLATLAETHGGTFTPVGVHPQAVQMSQTRPIPYHREPGPVWGTKVRTW